MIRTALGSRDSISNGKDFEHFLKKSLKTLSKQGHVNEKLFEDQRVPQNRMAKVRADPFGGSPFAVHDVTSRSAMLRIRTMNNRQKQRRNPNEARAGGMRK
ncbi:hypothetical protein Aduo_006438 [Ancylostoma duodenale]